MKESDANQAGVISATSLSATMQAGVVIDGRFDIKQIFGKGGMCTVYKAEDLTMHRAVAIKVLHDRLSADKDALFRFEREAKTISALNHPNIMAIYSFGCLPSHPYIVAEFVEGISLAQLIEKSGPLSMAQALPIFLQICDALEHAHSKGIIHRDIKPSNIMLVGPETTVKVVDFGIAKLLPESGKESQKLTQTGHVLGSIQYMSPEQLAGDTVDCRSDLYSMGCLMYEALVGSPPFSGDTALSVAYHQANSAVPASERLNNPVGKVILSALEKEPHRRPQSAEELKAYLLKPLNFKPKGRTPSGGRWHSWPLTLAVALVIAAVITIPMAVEIYFNSSQSPRFEHDETLPATAAQAEKWRLQRQEMMEKGREASLKEKPRDAAQAQPYFEKAWLVLGRERDPNGENSERTLALDRLVKSYEAQGKHIDADRLLSRELENRTKDFGPDSIGLAMVLSQKADLLEVRHDYPGAELLWRRALVIANHGTYKNKQASISTIRSGLAKNLIKQGKSSEKLEGP